VHAALPISATPAVAVAGLRAVEVLVTATAGIPVVLTDAPLGVGVLAASGEGVAPGASGAALLDGTLVGLLAGIVVLAVGARLALRTPRPVPLAAGTVPPAAGTVPPAAGTVRLGVAPVVRTGRVLAPWLVLVLVLALVLDPRLAGVTSLALLAVLAGALVVATARPVAASAHDPGATVRAVPRGARRALRPLTRPVPDARAAVRLHVLPVGRAERRAWRTAAVAGAGAAVVLLVAGSWVARPTATVGALVVGALLLAARAAAPRGLHAALVGTAYA